MRNFFSTTFKSAFLKKLINQCFEANWVDIENEFYKELVSTFLAKSDKKEQQVNDLNNTLAYIITLLEEYLSSLPKPKNIDQLNSILMSRIQQSDFVDEMPDLGKLPDRKLILNFNYTDTIERYLSTDEESPFYYQVNYIHGKIHDPKNQLIFGFGDELDDNYKPIEHANINAFFKHIKSFWYFKTSNYRNLIRFIETGDFEVYIMGHSCGLSDRTMLNMIFEHKNCLGIKVFYHRIDAEHNNYENATQEISRHFTDKSSMRRKVLPFDRSIPMPQAAK